LVDEAAKGLLIIYVPLSDRLFAISLQKGILEAYPVYHNPVRAFNRDSFPNCANKLHGNTTQLGYNVIYEAVTLGFQNADNHCFLKINITAGCLTGEVHTYKVPRWQGI
jgi:hypothetical protein